MALLRAKNIFIVSMETMGNKIVIKPICSIEIFIPWANFRNWLITVIYILCTRVGSDDGPVPRMLVADIVMLISVEGELQPDSS